MTMLEKAWIDIGTITDIPKLGARVVKTRYGCIAVFRAEGDRVFALEDRCPHKGGPLSQGIVHGTSVTCPLHNMVISLESGRALGADEGEVAKIELKVEEGRLLMSAADLKARG